MKNYDENTAPGTLLQSGVKTIAMSLGDPKFRPLVLKFKPRQDELEKANDTAKKAHNDLLMAEGEAELPAALCYEDVDDMQGDLAKAVEKNYQAPLYKSIFPDGLSAFKEQSPEELDKKLPVLIQHLKDSGSDKLIAHVPTFQAHKNALKKPLENLAAATTRNASAQLALGKAKAAWLDAYSSLEAEFHVASPRRKRFVARFFPTTGGHPKKKDDPKVAELQKKNDELTAQVTDLQNQVTERGNLLVGLQAANDALTKQVADLQGHLAAIGLAPFPGGKSAS